MLMPYDDPSFSDAWLTWTEYRKEIKKPYKSEKSIQARLNWFKKNKLTLSEAIEAIEYSIMNGWTGIFPNKNNNNGQQPIGSGSIFAGQEKLGTSAARIEVLKKW